MEPNKFITFAASIKRQNRNRVQLFTNLGCHFTDSLFFSDVQNSMD